MMISGSSKFSYNDWWKLKVKLNKKNRYLHYLLKAQDPEKAEQIRLGIESSSDESSDD